MSYQCPKCSEAIEVVPNERFQEVYNERRDFQEQLTAAEAKATAAEALSMQVSELTARLDTQSNAHIRTVAVMAAGVTDADDIADLMALYDRRAPEGSDIGTWLSARDTLPRSAAALLPQLATPTNGAELPTNGADTPPVPSPPEQMPAPTPPPATNTAAVPYTGAPQTWTPENIGRADYRAHRAAIRASMGLPPAKP